MSHHIRQHGSYTCIFINFSCMVKEFPSASYT